MSPSWDHHRKPKCPDPTQSSLSNYERATVHMKSTAMLQKVLSFKGKPCVECLECGLVSVITSPTATTEGASEKIWDQLPACYQGETSASCKSEEVHFVWNYGRSVLPLKLWSILYSLWQHWVCIIMLLTFLTTGYEYLQLQGCFWRCEYSDESGKKILE